MSFGFYALGRGTAFHVFEELSSVILTDTKRCQLVYLHPFILSGESQVPAVSSLSREDKRAVPKEVMEHFGEREPRDGSHAKRVVIACTLALRPDCLSYTGSSIHGFSLFFRVLS